MRGLGFEVASDDAILGRTLEAQRQAAFGTLGSGDDRFFSGEFQKWIENKVETSSAYHHVGMKSGIPIPANRFEYQGDLAVEFLKGEPRKDSERFSPVSGEMALSLPQFGGRGEGVQDYAWRLSEEGKGGAGQVSYYPAVEKLLSAEGKYSVYGKLWGGKEDAPPVISQTLAPTSTQKLPSKSRDDVLSYSTTIQTKPLVTTQSISASMEAAGYASGEPTSPSGGINPFAFIGAAFGGGSIGTKGVVQTSPFGTETRLPKGLSGLRGGAVSTPVGYAQTGKGAPDVNLMDVGAGVIGFGKNVVGAGILGFKAFDNLSPKSAKSQTSSIGGAANLPPPNTESLSGAFISKPSGYAQAGKGTPSIDIDFMGAGKTILGAAALGFSAFDSYIKPQGSKQTTPLSFAGGANLPPPTSESLSGAFVSKPSGYAQTGRGAPSIDIDFVGAGKSAIGAGLFLGGVGAKEFSERWGSRLTAAPSVASMREGSGAGLFLPPDISTVRGGAIQKTAYYNQGGGMPDVDMVGIGNAAVGTGAAFVGGTANSIVDFAKWTGIGSRPSITKSPSNTTLGLPPNFDDYSTPSPTQVKGSSATFTPTSPMGVDIGIGLGEIKRPFTSAGKGMVVSPPSGGSSFTEKYWSTWDQKKANASPDEFDLSKGVISGLFPEITNDQFKAYQVANSRKSSFTVGSEAVGAGAGYAKSTLLGVLSWGTGGISEYSGLLAPETYVAQKATPKTTRLIGSPVVTTEGGSDEIRGLSGWLTKTAIYTTWM
jgi:hypothetical protein